jgi:hypothetical protein
MFASQFWNILLPFVRVHTEIIPLLECLSTPKAGDGETVTEKAGDFSSLTQHPGKDSHLYPHHKVNTLEA